MTHVMSFEDHDGWADYLRSIGESMEGMYERCLEEQRALQAGDYYVRIDLDGLPIFGRVVPLSDPSDEKWMADRPWLRMVYAHSQACPRGELGTEHVSLMIPITQGVWTAAGFNNWRPWPDLQRVVEEFWVRMKRTCDSEMS